MRAADVALSFEEVVIYVGDRLLAEFVFRQLRRRRRPLSRVTVGAIDNWLLRNQHEHQRKYWPKHLLLDQERRDHHVRCPAVEGPPAASARPSMGPRQSSSLRHR